MYVKGDKSSILAVVYHVFVHISCMIIVDYVLLIFQDTKGSQTRFLCNKTRQLLVIKRMRY